MPIVVISEALLRRTKAVDGRILRDRTLSGFCVRLNARKRTFMVATSVRGEQFRMMLGYWPLMGVDEARMQALDVLRRCRSGERPSRPIAQQVPTLREAYLAYCADKRIKPSSKKRYESFYRTHFGEWLDRPVTALGHAAFAEHCKVFAQSKGNALVELGRGTLGAVLKYINALYALNLPSPFVKLAAVGLLPPRTQPRARVLQEADLPRWRQAVESLPARPRDYLFFTLLSGLRRNEARGLRCRDVDLPGGVLSVPDTKTGKPHSLPITPLMRMILVRRCEGLGPDDELFARVSADHVAKMAMRVGAPRFMLHDLRKLLATVGQRIGVGDAVMRRILNHTAPRADVLHRHYVEVVVEELTQPLQTVQEALFPSDGWCGKPMP
jgi:integrase